MPENTSLILIHGLGQNPSSWNSVISYLPQNTQTHCFNLCFLTSKNEVTYKRLYRAFENYCMNISGRIILCGLSLGAILAINYSIDHPENITKLILIAPQYKIPQFLFDLQAVLFRFMPSRSFQVGFNKEQTICLTSSMRTLDFSRTISNIACPTLVICGENDRANRKAAKKLASLIPTAELCFICGAGHEVNIDAPKVLSDVMKSFWQK